MALFSSPRRHKSMKNHKSRRLLVRPSLEILEVRNLLSNGIVQENLLPGTPQSVWDVPGAGDSTIQGYATDISVNLGQTVNFKINDTANAPYHIDIYRLGYYQGLGARLITTISSTQTVIKLQPNPVIDATTALVDAGNWSVTASWTVPTTVTSGVYFARVTRNDTGGAFMIPFVVRNDSSHSQVLFQTSDATWEAYNTWGGYSLYQSTTGTPGPGYAGAAYAVSYNRPFIDRGTPGGLGDTNFVFYDEFPMIRYLESNGYDVSYFTDMDSDRYGSLIQQHQVFLSVGHDEYWSGNQMANVTAARDAGVNLAFFSGNEAFWKTYLAPSIDGSNTPNRTLVDYKETHANAIIDPKNPNIWTGTWMDPRFSPPADGGRPQNQLTGTLFTVNRGADDTGTPFTVPATDAKLRFWRNTSVASLTAGQTATLGDFVLGYEWDEDVDNGFRPAGLIDMSSTTQSVTQKFLDYGNTTGPGTATHSLTLYRASSGALVFGAGTVQFDWGLDGTHDGANGQLGLNSTPVPALQQAVVNLFADMNIQPDSLQPGLIFTKSSTDITPPSSVITSPSSGASILTGSAVTITGTATDSGGGVVGGVEVSVDGGQTWHPATGVVAGTTTSWSYTWIPDTAGQVTIKSRAADDSGNIESPSAGRTVMVTYQPTSRTGLVGEFGFNEGTGTTLTDSSGANNNGTISNATWAPGMFGGSALSFNGTNSWVTINGSNSLNLTAGMTLEAWVNPTSLSDWSAVILKERAGGLDYALYADNGAGQPPAAYVHVTGTDYSTLSGSALPLNTWSHLTATYDGSNMKIYVNGTLASTQFVGGNIITSNNVLRIGGDSIWGEYFSGRIDQVRIYNRALNQAEIRSDMSTPVGGTLDSTPPTVSLTGPAPGATASGVTAISANALDNVYAASVQFLLDGQSLGNAVMAAPYTLAWDTRRVTNGSHVLSARATDIAGNTTTSTVETVTVANPPNTTPPTVVVTYPPTGFFTNGTIVLNGVASDPVGIASVQFQLNGVNIGGALTAAPYRLLWNSASVSDGVYNLVAVATDTSGNATTSAPVSITVNHTGPTVISTTPATGSAGVSTASSLTAQFSESIQSSTLSFSLKDPSGNAVATTVSYDDSTHTATFAHGSVALEPLTTYTAKISGVMDQAGNVIAAPFSWTFSTGNAIANATIWGSSSTPGVPSANDPSAVELGLKFRSDVAGTISGIRFYKGGPANSGTHVGHLWTSTGQLLGTVTFTGESAFGWEQATFATPIAIVANTTYIVSYYAPTGGYAADSNYFATTGVDSGPLHALANGVDGSNGLYLYGTGGGFPTNSYLSTNYWVDVVFSSSATNTTPPTVTGESPAANASNVAQGAALTATFSEAVQPGTISFVVKDASGNSVAGTQAYSAGTNTVSFTPTALLNATTTYTATISNATDLSGNVMASPFAWSFTTTNPSLPPTVVTETPAPGATGVVKGTTISVRFSKQVVDSTINFSLKDSSGTVVPTTISYDDEANTATLTPNSALATGSTFTASVSGATDLSNNVMVGSVTWSFTTAFVVTGNTIWASTATPTVASANDTSSLELGVKFRADTAGAITGLRFYKGAGNTGTHVGHLWDDFGNLLATATFSGETASGWQQVNFSTPVNVSPNTTYVASYFAPNGGYAYSSAYFASSGVDNGPLHALANGVDGGNGVFRYGSTGAFPNVSYNSTNYWVDVIFNQTADTTPPTVTATTPPANATNIPTGSAGTPLTVTFSKPVQSNTIVFALTDAAGNTIATTMSFNSATNTATFTPNAALAGLTTFTAKVSGTKDLSGNTMVGTTTWSFTTAPAIYSLWNNSAAPAAPSAADTSTLELGTKFRTDVNGTITGVRFYKGVNNTGTHIGNLWDNSGNLLATVTFTGETATGWQQASFSTPVNVVANTTYIISYYAPNGGYAYDPAYFASSGVNSGPVHALANGVDGGNGVFHYGVGSAFPNSTYNSTNYWVDVVFTPSYAGSWKQTTAADFTAGALTNTGVTNTSGGEVQLAQTQTTLDDFTGTSLNASNWTTQSWTSAGGGATTVGVANSILSVQGAAVYSTQAYPNSTIEASVDFAAVAYQHVGLATSFNAVAGNSWVMFSTGGTTNTLFARVNSNGTTQDVNLGALPTGFHTYKIRPIGAGGFEFYVDGALKTTIALTIPSGTNLLLAVSDFQGTAGSPLQVNWFKKDTFASSGTYLSSIYDATRSVTWGAVNWNALVPAGTTMTVQTQTSTDGVNWSSWSTVSNGGASTSPAGRYIRYQVIFSTTDVNLTAILQDITFNFS